MPYVVPDVLDAPGQPVSTASFWGDSAVVLPWEIYMASDNHWLLTDVLRREWGFQGMVVTDWGALCNRVKAMHAGCDLSMPGGSNYMEDWVEAAVQDGSLPESDVDACAARVIALVLKSQTRPKGKPFDREAHHALARRVAESGAVLLKNEDGILPLQAEDVVLIGEMARTMRYQGSGSSHINPTRLISLCEAWPQAPFVPGCDTKGAVVAAVQRAAHEEQRVERHTPDAVLVQLPGVLRRVGRNAAQIVVEHPHIDARGGLAAQNLDDGVPEHTVAHDEIFQKDEMLRRFQVGQQVGEKVIPQVVEFGPGVGLQRRPGDGFQIQKDLGQPRVGPGGRHRHGVRCAARGGALPGKSRLALRAAPRYNSREVVRGKEVLPECSTVWRSVTIRRPTAPIWKRWCGAGRHSAGIPSA